MKKLILIAASMMVAAAVYGQGQFSFTNRDTANGVNARISLSTDAAGVSSVGTDYTISLMGGPVGGTLVALEPASATFRGAAGSNLAGYINPVTVTVPGVQPGGNATIEVTIKGPGIDPWVQKYTVNGLGGGTILPPTIPFGNAAIAIPPAVPEPTTLALGALGIGALLAIRRRK